MDDNKKQFQNRQQVFYFNDEGELIVESNRGIWKDGEQYVKMYGQFQCNAKTLGIIIERFKGWPVVVAETTKNTHYDLWHHSFDETTSAIVNPTDDDKGLIRKNDMLAARNNNLGKQVEDLKEEIEDKKEDLARYLGAIDKFNKLPWYKRIFNKVKV